MGTLKILGILPRVFLIKLSFKFTLSKVVFVYENMPFRVSQT